MSMMFFTKNTINGDKKLSVQFKSHTQNSTFSLIVSQRLSHELFQNYDATRMMLFHNFSYKISLNVTHLNSIYCSHFTYIMHKK